MDDDELSPEDWELVVTVRNHLTWLDTQPASDWVVETLGMIHGDIVRKWYPNPRMMEYQQPVGEWRSVRVRRAKDDAPGGGGG